MQVDLNKKWEDEIGKLRLDLEEANIQHDGTLDGLQKKNVDATSEMSEHKMITLENHQWIPIFNVKIWNNSQLVKLN